ncbi:MAG: TVP38/TMEM64 family protein [Christensenellales bacterium]
MKKAIMLIISSLISAGLISLCFLTPCFSLLWQVIFTIAISLTLIAIFLGSFWLTKIYKFSIVCLVVETIVVAIYLILFYSGLLVHFQSRETLQAWMESFGAWGPIIFFIVELAQVILIPVPAQITTLAGVFAFGSLKAFFISSLAVILGSLIAFGVGRALGVPVLYKIAKKETVDKYRKLISKKGRMLLPIMFLFPLFPDDLLCFVAGTTTMTWTYFIVVTLLTRLVGIGCICVFLSGDLIPFSGWGIPVWIVLVILLVGTSFVLLKYQDKIENFIIKKFTKGKSQKSKAKRINKKTVDSVKNAQFETADNYVAFAENKEEQNSHNKDKTV